MVSYKGYEILKESLNNNITIKGKISETPWQQIIGSFKEYPYTEYFDLEDGFQICIYSKAKIKNKKLLEVTGKVVEILGRSKRPLYEEEKYSEYHILVESCLEV
jgi:hypothetical protein